MAHAGATVQLLQLPEGLFVGLADSRREAVIHGKAWRSAGPHEGGPKT